MCFQFKLGLTHNKILIIKKTEVIIKKKYYIINTHLLSILMDSQVTDWAFELFFCKVEYKK